MRERDLTGIGNRPQNRGVGRGSLAVLFTLVLAGFTTLRAFGSGDGSDLPPSPQQLYNDGTQKFRQGKLPEAEAALQSALQSQNDKVRVPALYNLGHVRNQAGDAELKKGPDNKATQAAASHASESADSALRAADEALAAQDVQDLVSAYMQGRGAHKEIKAATEAVKHALESNGAVLEKWRRAAGDFKSAQELRPADQDAQINAEIIDRKIAKLVDLQQMMMQMKGGMDKQHGALHQKLKKMKEKMQGDPGQQFKGGEEDDDDEDEGKPPKEPKPGEKEGPSKDGKEKQLTPEEAEGLLGMLRLDANRKLPLGVSDTATPKDLKNRRDW
jgi:tetratricopeptide (TPR) repeat protein